MSSRYPGGVVRKNQLVPTTSSASGVWDLNEATQATKSDIWPYSGIANPISQSLRFRASNTNYLARTYGTPTNNKVWTWSAWVKRGSLSLADANHLFMASPTDVSGNPSTYGRLVFETDGTLRYQSALSAVATESFTSSAVYRDPSAWYHIVLYMDAVNTTVRGYVNGTEITYASRTNPTNTNTAINGSGNYHRIGLFRSAELRPFDGYMADVNFIDGQALDPSYFGQTSAITGVWEPKQYSGTYGNNGWHLEFKDTTVGQDTSGNNNDWTPNNFSTTLGTTYDLMTDVPTQFSPRGTTDVGGVVRGNYATLNPIDAYDNAPTQGNLARIGVGHTGSPWSTCRGTMGVTSGKWYFEATLTGSSGSYQSNSMVGVMTAATSALNDAYGGSTSRSYQANGGLQGDNSTGSVSSAVSGDVIMCAFDIDAGKVWFGKNGTFFNSGVPASGTGNVFTSVPTTPVVPAVHMYGNTGDNNGWYLNFGQRPFAYTPPSGFKSLCTTNLPTPTIGATVATAANKYFDATLYTGNGTTQSITNSGSMKPDWVWLKARSNAYTHVLVDSIRGTDKVLFSPSTSAENNTNPTEDFTAFNSNGFSVGTPISFNSTNASGATIVAWQWRASNAAAVTNTAGTISSQVSANPTSGFSIVTYTGNATSSQTVGHGLGTTPTFFILKSRGIQVWNVYSLAGGIIGNTILQLNTTDAAVTGGNINLTASPTTIGFGSASQVNGSGVGFVAYVFAPVDGYSAFGSYTGNGSTDGTFVYTGFRPKFILRKWTDGSNQWVIFDTSRDTHNVASKSLYPNLTNAEETIYNLTDILSNGFKMRTTDNSVNGSGGTYIYMAFAEHPFKNSLAR